MFFFNKNKFENFACSKKKCGKIIIEMHYFGLFIMLMMGKMSKAKVLKS
jgi:hypothetical protein